jgi:hypothetical protein
MISGRAPVARTAEGGGHGVAHAGVVAGRDQDRICDFHSGEQAIADIRRTLPEFGDFGVKHSHWFRLAFGA